MPSTSTDIAAIHFHPGVSSKLLRVCFPGDLLTGSRGSFGPVLVGSLWGAKVLSWLESCSAAARRVAAVERTLLGKPAPSRLRRFPPGLQQVGDGVFAWLQPNGEWGESNAGVVVGDGEALLIDTLFDLTAHAAHAGRRRRARPTSRSGRWSTRTRTVTTCSAISSLSGADIVATERRRRSDPRGVGRHAAPVQAARAHPADGGPPSPARGRNLPLPRLPRVPLRALGEYVGRMLSPFDFSGVRITPPTREFEAS